MFSQIDPAMLLARLETRRVELGALRSRGEDSEPLSWVEVAAQAGTHSATFSRLKAGRLPGDETMTRLLAWLGVTDPFDLVPDPDDEEVNQSGDEETGELIPGTGIPSDGVARGEELHIHPVDDPPEDAICAFEGCEAKPTHGQGDDETLVTLYCAEHAEQMEQGGGCGCEHSQEAAAAAAGSDVVDKNDTRVAAILGEGRLSESEDPETQALVTRARELMIEGAAGVSIKHDMDPEDMPDPAELDAAIEAEDWDKVDALLADVHARPRHVALVDTAAFSDARLTIDPETGLVSGPVTFEGHWTGDVRRLPYGVLTWDDDLLPIPITMGHEGPGGTQPPIIGYIDKLERVEGVTSSMRPILGEEAVTAAAGASALPAAYFREFRMDKPQPLRVDPPDANGHRRIYGIAAPRGVCHRSAIEGGGTCFQYPGDVDKALSHFHTGAMLGLDDGTAVRVGALTSGGLHVDTALASKVSAREVNRHREDTNLVLGIVRAWDTPHGLAVNGVVAANVDEHRLLQALAGAPSVELWPAGRGRTLVGIHVVPTPAWPVTASAGGSAISLTTGTPIEIDPEAFADEGDPEADPPAGDMSEVTASLARIEKALAILLNEIADEDIPEPEEDQ